jgi:hypothetical protein
LSAWFRSALRDWRIWALTVTLQLPAARAIVRYAPLPIVTFPLTVVLSFAFYAACFHGPLRRVSSGTLSRAGAALVVATVACIIFAIYPRADARKASGRGSDEDDALITTATRLIRLERPLYVPTYLGNAPSVGVGWAALVSPLAVSGLYFLLTPLALAVLAWVVAGHGGEHGGPGLALMLPVTSVAFWELAVTGSDLFAVGVLFVTLTAWARRRRLSALAMAGGVVLTVAAASARAPFAAVTACLALLLWRTRRAVAAVVALATAAVVAFEVSTWAPDPDATPLHLLTKIVGILGPIGVAVSAIAAIAGVIVALAQMRDNAANWWRGLWLLLVAPLAATSVGMLARMGWEVASWQAAGYVEVAVPALVASLAVEAGRGTLASPDTTRP